jgi:hypothetical protein
LNWQVWAGVLVDQGSAPTVAPGAAVALQTGRDAWSVGLEGRAHQTPFTTTGDGAASSTLWLGGVDVCGRRAGFAGCLLGQVGWQTAAGEGFDENGSVAGLYAAAGARATAAFALSARWVVRLNLDLTAPLSRLRLTQAEAPLWETAPVVISSGLMLGWRWSR